MHDTELDDLLRRAAPTSPTAEAGQTAHLLVDRIPPHPRAHPRPRPRRWRPALVAGVLGGALALSAAGTLAAYELSIPPFQTVPNGLQRLDAAIPLDYAATDGEVVRCRVFLEFADLSRGQLARLDEAVAQERWTPQRQRRLTGAAVAPTTQEELFNDRLLGRLFDFAAGVVPGLTLQQLGDDRPTLTGYGASCREEAAP